MCLLVLGCCCLPTQYYQSSNNIRAHSSHFLYPHGLLLGKQQATSWLDFYHSWSFIPSVRIGFKRCLDYRCCTNNLTNTCYKGYQNSKPLPSSSEVQA